MHMFGRIVKYVLRSLFSLIVVLLLVGFAKTDWKFNAYVQFLDSTDFSVFHLSQPSTWNDLFWPNTQSTGTVNDIADIFSGDTFATESTGVDVYDPAFEDEFNVPDTGMDSDLVSGANQEVDF